MYVLDTEWRSRWRSRFLAEDGSLVDEPDDSTHFMVETVYGFSFKAKQSGLYLSSVRDERHFQTFKGRIH